MSEPIPPVKKVITPEVQDGTPVSDAPKTDSVLKLPCRDSFFIFGDTQYPYSKAWTAIQTSIVNSRSPAKRLPLSELAVSPVYYWLAKQHDQKIPGHCKESSLGAWHLGDIGDL